MKYQSLHPTSITGRERPADIPVRSENFLETMFESEYLHQLLDYHTSGNSSVVTGDMVTRYPPKTHSVMRNPKHSVVVLQVPDSVMRSCSIEHQRSDSFLLQSSDLIATRFMSPAMLLLSF